MKREFLKGFELSDDVIEQIMAQHGQGIEKYKSELTELDQLKARLTDAEAQLEVYQGMDIEGVKQAAKENAAKHEQEKSQLLSEIHTLKLEHALSSTLEQSKAKNAQVVRALLDMDKLVLSEDGTLSGLDTQLEKIKAENEYLFHAQTPIPSLILPSNGAIAGITAEDFSKMTYMEKYRLKTEQPEVYQQLSGKA